MLNHKRYLTEDEENFLEEILKNCDNYDFIELYRYLVSAKNIKKRLYNRRKSLERNANDIAEDIILDMVQMSLRINILLKIVSGHESKVGGPPIKEDFSKKLGINSSMLREALKIITIGNNPQPFFVKNDGTPIKITAIKEQGKVKS